MKYKVIKTDNAPNPIGPYSQAREFGGLVFISGQIAIDPQTGEMANGNIVIETVQVMKNLNSRTPLVQFWLLVILIAIIMMTWLWDCLLKLLGRSHLQVQCRFSMVTTQALITTVTN